jgi:hypothetical protein
MKSWRDGLTFSSLLVGLALFVSGPSTAASPSYVLAVQASYAGHLLGPSEIKKMLTGRITAWPDGMPVVIVLPPKGSPEVEWASQTYLNMPEQFYRRHLMEQSFRGAISKPKSSSGAQDTCQIISSVPGALGPLPFGVACPGTLTANLEQ